MNPLLEYQTVFTRRQIFSRTAARIGAIAVAFVARASPAGAQPPAVGPKLGEKWENSLGMKFVPVPGAQVLFCIWETRVQDFENFVKESGHDPKGLHSWDQTERTYKVKPDDSWRSPGFAQTGLHPVCGVSWADAKRFCQWLTERERAAGKLGPEHEYRLPTDAEWSAAAGGGKYPWGEQWPPPAGAGNYASEGDDLVGKTDGYADGAPRTAKVGSYTANRLGIYDLGGNLWEWCEDWYRKEMNSAELRKIYPRLDDDGGGSAFRVVRGSAWVTYSPYRMASSGRRNELPDARRDIIGFRCVVAVGASAL